MKKEMKKGKKGQRDSNDFDSAVTPSHIIYIVYILYTHIITYTNKKDKATLWKAQWRHSFPVRPLCLIVRIDAAIISCIAHHCPVQCPGH